MKKLINFNNVAREWKWWKNRGVFKVENEHRAYMESGEQTDFFNDPAPGGDVKGSAPFLYTPLTGPFTASVQLTPSFGKTYDAGGLMVMGDDENIWIKLAFESTDLGYPAVVSVVTNIRSDDANGAPLSSSSISLQIVRTGNLFALHYSHEKDMWQMVRYFSLPISETCKLGIFTQSPMGQGNKTSFTNLAISEQVPKNLRSGRF